MIVELVGGHLDGHLMDVTEHLGPVLLIPKPAEMGYVAESTPVAPRPLETLTYRHARRARVLAAVVGDLMLPADALLGHPLARPVLDTDLDPAEGRRYVLRE